VFDRGGGADAHHSDVRAPGELDGLRLLGGNVDGRLDWFAR
jgi:hypothetical protein